MIPLARPDITDDDIEAVARVLRTGQLVQGKNVAEFESAIAQLSGGGEVVAVSNCTAALQLALLSLGVGPGDDVGVATYSWPATANAIVLCGARPVFIDIESRTLGMNPTALEATLNRGAKLKAIIPVHAFGNMANMPEIIRVANAYRVPVIEDAACALGAELEGKPAGGWGVIGCYSFHPRKAATTGEGGAVRTNASAIAQKVRTLRNHGIKPQHAPADFTTAGFNMRMTEFQAALGNSQLSRYDRLIEKRRSMARSYDQMLAGLPVELPQHLGERSHIYQSYVVRIQGASSDRRNQIIRELGDRGIETNFGTHHIPLLSFFLGLLGHRRGDFPVTDSVAASALALPLYPGLRESDQRHVVKSLTDALSD